MILLEGGKRNSIIYLYGITVSCILLYLSTILFPDKAWWIQLMDYEHINALETIPEMNVSFVS